MQKKNFNIDTHRYSVQSKNELFKKIELHSKNDSE